MAHLKQTVRLCRLLARLWTDPHSIVVLVNSLSKLVMAEAIYVQNFSASQAV